MPTSSEEIQRFQQYATARRQSGGEQLELDDLLYEWKHQNSDLLQLQQGALAIKASLNDQDQGVIGRPVAGVVAEIRDKYKLLSDIATV